MSGTGTRDEPLAGSPLCDADGHAWVWTWPIEGGEGAVGQCSLCGRITTAERDAAVRAEVERLRGVVEAVQALADELEDRAGNRTARPKLRIDIHEAVDLIREALASVPSSEEVKPRSWPQRVDLAEIDAQREKGWPDFHPEDFCHRCGHRNVSWYADSETWNVVMRGSGPAGWGGWQEIVCPPCFTELAAGHGFSAWRLTRDEHGTWALSPAPVVPGGQADGEGPTRVVDEAGLLALPSRSVITGPAWSSEVYLKAGPDVWFAPAQPDEWTSRTLSHRGPFVVLRLGDAPLAARPVLSREAVRINPAALAEYLHEWERTCKQMGLRFTLDDAAKFVADAGPAAVLVGQEER